METSKESLFGKGALEVASRNIGGSLGIYSLMSESMQKEFTEYHMSQDSKVWLEDLWNTYQLYLAGKPY